MNRMGIGLLLVVILSCAQLPKEDLNTPSPRTPQQAAEVVQSESESEKTYSILMNETSDGLRSQRVANYLDRQLDFYYIAFGMVNDFDIELDKIHKIKKANPGAVVATEDLQKMDRMLFQLRIAREFSERNLHDILDIYGLALKNANDPASPFHRASGWIITNISDWLKDSSKKGNKLAIINLAQFLDDENRQFRIEMTSGGKKIIKIPSFENHYTLSNAALNAATLQSRQFYAARKPTRFDSLIGKKWLEYEAERVSQNSEQELAEWSDSGRKPQALDSLYPDPGGSGHVTGNRFPANTWAMTLDDGPHPTHTPGMFKVFSDAGMPVTFFWLTKNMLAYPQLVSQSGQMGFNRGSHSYTHANLPTLNQTGLNHEINDALDGFKKMIGTDATLFRCPYGACKSESTIRQMIAKRNALHIHWNVDSLDWQDKDPNGIFERTKKQMEVRDHGIVLFHDVHSQSVAALKILTSWIKQKGYKVKRLHEIIGEVREKPYTSP